MEKLAAMMIVVFTLIFSNFKFSGGFNIDLIFSLQQNFCSDVVLFEKLQENEKVVKRLLRYQESQPKAFIGLLDFDNNYKFFIDSPNSSKYHNELVIFYNNNNFIKKLVELQKIDPNVMISFIWIYFMKNSDEKQNLEILNIPFNSKFFLIEEINNFSLEIIEVYQINSSFPKIYSRYAVWENEELKLLKNKVFPSRNDLQGHEINTLVPYYETGYHSWLHWDFLSLGTNSTLRFTVIEREGMFYENGTKTEEFQLVYDHGVDGSTGYYGTLSERMNDFDFIFPTMIVRNKLYVEVKQGLHWESFITPFNIDIWISIITWVAFAYILMRIINRMISPVFKYRFEDPVFGFITAFCNQGRNIRQEKFLFYICMLMPYVLGIVLLQYYSAVLLSHLTVKDSTSPFRNLQDVLDDGSYEIACFYPSFLYDMISHYYKSKGQTKKPVALAGTSGYSAEMFNDVCEHRRVLLAGTLGIDANVDCTVVELPESVGVLFLGIMVWKGFPYQRVMSKMLRHFQSRGLIKLYYKNVVSELESDYTLHPVGLGTVFPAYLLLLSFLFLSILIILLEIILWKFKKKCHHNKIKINLTKLKFSKLHHQKFDF